jgi:hypothetical protein
MESFKIDLNEMSSKKPRVRKLLVLGAIICLGFMVASFAIFLTLDSKLEWYFMVAAIYFALYVHYAWISYKADLFVKADTLGFDYNFGLIKRSKNSISWDTVSKVKFGPAYVRFIKRSGRRKLVQLNWLPYAKVIEIKDSLIKICEYKKVPYEKAEIIDYSIKKNKNVK